MPAGLAAGSYDAVALNVTVTAATGGGYLSIWPTGTPRPNTSVLNYEAAHDGANTVIVKVGSGQ